MEKEVKFMEAQQYKATINRQDQKAILLFELPGITLTVPLTEDKPNEVKEVFNKLIAQLKQGNFQFELVDDKSDLFHFISEEYITQLNTELEAVYSELEDYGLLAE